MSSSQLSRSQTKRHKWALNFTRGKSETQLTTYRVAGGDSSDLALPPGYLGPATNGAGGGPAGSQPEIRAKPDPNLVVKRSWDIALGPMKQIPMNLFIMYMAGNSISIFPIMMVGMLFLKPVRALITVGSTFKLIEGEQHILQKLIYFLGNVAGLALALYKCQSMGLLPTHPSDWLDFLSPPLRVEYAGGGVGL